MNEKKSNTSDLAPYSNLRIYCTYDYRFRHKINVRPISVNGKTIPEFSLSFDTDSVQHNCMKKYCDLGKKEYELDTNFGPKEIDYVSFTADQIQLMYNMKKVTESDLKRLFDAYESIDEFSDNFDIVVIAIELSQQEH